MARREEHGVPSFHPKAADRAADVPRSDDTDLRLLVARRLRKRKPRTERCSDADSGRQQQEPASQFADEFASWHSVLLGDAASSECKRTRQPPVTSCTVTWFLKKARARAAKPE